MIKSIHLENYRSYDDLHLELDPKINILIGKNAQGKTNLLEAIFFISNTRSFRTRNDMDLIKDETDYSRIIIQLASKKLVCVIHKKGKYFEIDNIAIERTSDFIGELKTILFYPNESELFTASPGTRRNFIDNEISKVNKKYLTNLKEYNHLLRERNKVLKEKNLDEQLIDVFDEKLSVLNFRIIKERQLFITSINQNINYYFDKLSNKEKKLRIEYKNDFLNMDSISIKNKYQHQIKRDHLFGATQLGIHRDDLLFFMDDKEVYKHASQGQTRLILIAIKLSLIQFIVDETGELPILLLDDILSELDLEHQLNLLASIPHGIQTIITTTEELEGLRNNNTSKFYIENSQVVRKEG